MKIIDVTTYFESVKITKEKLDEESLLDNEADILQSNQETLKIKNLQKNVKFAKETVLVKPVSFSVHLFPFLQGIRNFLSLSLSLSLM